jgi:hypothetical protein
VHTPSRKIAYVGCAMAGKLGSLGGALLLNHQALPEPPEELRRRPHEYTLTRGGIPIVHVSVLISDRRATIAKYDPTSWSCDRGVRSEIDFIADADGLVVVIDSRVGREEANLADFERLKHDIASRGVDSRSKPMVFQANKRDELNVVPMAWVRENFCSDRCSYIESNASRRVGSLEALREVLRLTHAIE